MTKRKKYTLTAERQRTLDARIRAVRSTGGLFRIEVADICESVGLPDSSFNRMCIRERLRELDALDIMIDEDEQLYGSLYTSQNKGRET